MKGAHPFLSTVSADGTDVSPSALKWKATTQFACLFLLLALVVAIYWLMGVELVRVWERDPNYSHGYAVLPASLAFAFVAWKRHGPLIRPALSRGVVCRGLIQVALGLALHLSAWLAGILILDVASLIVVLCGVALLAGGRDAHRYYSFSILFLILMAPLPTALYSPIAVGMQQVVSSVSAQLLEASGAAVYREGYFIFLPGYTIEVGEACSGLRQLTAIVALAVAIGYLSGRGTGYRWTLALLAAPIAIAANCVRVVMTSVILVFFGRDWAEGFFHTLEGLAIVALSAVMMAFVALVLPVIISWCGAPSPAAAAGTIASE